MPIDAVTLYEEFWARESELEAYCGASLAPRSSDMLYDHFMALGAAPGQRVLDIGCRDAAHAVELARRFGCSVLGLDPAPSHIARAEAKIAASGRAGQVQAREAAIEALPVEDGAADMIWCRDVLNHVDLPRGLAECARALRPGGSMLVYQTFATDQIEPREAERIYRAMAIVPANMDERYFQVQAAAAGLEVTLRDVVSSEWRERWAEEGSTQLQEDLLWLARMRRRELDMVEQFGRDRYEATYCGCLWGIYQMLGKLQPTVYALRRA